MARLANIELGFLIDSPAQAKGMKPSKMSGHTMEVNRRTGREKPPSCQKQHYPLIKLLIGIEPSHRYAASIVGRKIEIGWCLTCRMYPA